MSLKQPNWNDKKDRALYDELFYGKTKYEDLTKEQQEFCKTMYHFEEYVCGLDGDRE